MLLYTFHFTIISCRQIKRKWFSHVFTRVPVYVSVASWDDTKKCKASLLSYILRAMIRFEGFTDGAATGCYFTNRNTKRRFYASYFPLSPTTCGRALLFCLLSYPAEAVSPVVMLLLLWGCWLKLGERQSHRVSRYEALETHLKRAHDSYAVRVSIQRPSVDNANRNKCSTDVFLFAFEQYCAWEANGIITIIIFIPARITFGLISCQAWK